MRRGLNTGMFSCFAHPDLFYFTGEETAYRSRMRRLCREAKACGVPLEYNLLGAGLGRNYPTPAFWEEAAAVGNSVIIGWDAHSPAWLERSDLEAQGISFLDSLSILIIPIVTPQISFTFYIVIFQFPTHSHSPSS